MNAHLPWSLRHLLLAPHRLGFFLAMVLLCCAGLWWTLVQWDRLTGVLGLPYVFSPSLVHGAVMTFGFMPLFFSGFLFTAGPKWLNVPPPEASQLLAPLLLQACGWLLWLVGVHVHPAWGVSGVLLALVGLLWMSALYWRLVWRSPVRDQVHARVIAIACAVGCLCVFGLLVSVWVNAYAWAMACVLTGLWGFVVAVYAAVAHRMIPFFTASAMPQVTAWRPFWALGLMLGAVLLEVLATWVDLLLPADTAWGVVWLLLRGTLELATGAILLWLAGVWGLIQSFQNRLLAMLHVGFAWLGLSLLLAGGSQWAGWMQGQPVMPFGALHGLTMGCLASLMLAMVTRVSAGHSGRPLQAGGGVWGLFWLLQVITVLRISAAWPGAHTTWLLAIAALAWVAIMLAWGAPLTRWYGQVRPDGRAG